MKKELFNDKEPYSNLVIAIKDDNVSVSNQIYSFDLLQLTRDLLTKDVKTRLDICSKERILKVISSKNSTIDGFDNNIDDILKMRIPFQAKFDEIEKLQRDRNEIKKRQKETGLHLANIIESVFNKIQQKGVFKSFQKSERFLFDSDKHSNKDIVQNYLYELIGDLKMGFPKNLFILVRMSNDENNYSEIELLGIFPYLFKGNQNAIHSPILFFQELYKEKNPYNQSHANYAFNTINIYKGIVEFDESFETYIASQIVKLILKSLKSVETIVNEEIDWQEEITKSTKTFNSRITTGPRSIFIDRL
jgi:hypothetical protein